PRRPAHRGERRRRVQGGGTGHHEPRCPRDDAAPDGHGSQAADLLLQRPEHAADGRVGRADSADCQRSERQTGIRATPRGKSFRGAWGKPSPPFHVVHFRGREGKPMARMMMNLLFRTVPFLLAAAALGQSNEIPAGVIRSALGVTRKATPIECWLTADDLDYNTKKTRVLLVGGLDRSTASAETVRQAMRWFYTAP